MSTRSIGIKLITTAAVALFIILASVMAGQTVEWKPTKPIEFVAPFAPGGGSDVLARSIVSVIDAEKLSPVPLLVVNRAGGSGLVGTSSVVQQRGNPHTLLTFISGQASAPLVAGREPYLSRSHHARPPCDRRKFDRCQGRCPF